MTGDRIGCRPGAADPAPRRAPAGSGAPVEMPEGWTDVADVADLAPSGRHVCELDGRSILLCRSGGEILAVSNRCTHLSQPLDKGRIMAGNIYCPHHSACFDLRTGEAVSGPAVTRLPCFAVRVEAGRVWVRSG